MASAVVLLSGGLDSTTAAALARREGWALYGLTGDGDIPKDRDLESPNPRILESSNPQIPSTYVPARNTVLLSLALAWAEALAAERIVIGVNALDYSGYPDCRPEFIAAFEYLASLGTRIGVEGRSVRVWAPLQHLTKAGIIRVGMELGLDYGLTRSCYDPRPDGRPCEHCDSCRLRARGFEDAGVPDPLLFPAR